MEVLQFADYIWDSQQTAVLSEKALKKTKQKKTVHHPLRTKQQSDTFRDELVVEQLAAEEAESILD